MRKIPPTPNKTQGINTCSLLLQAFDNSLLANIISSVSNGKIILANNATYKLLGYSKKTLLSKRRKDIFDVKQSSFKKMMKQETAEGQSITLGRAIKKSGKSFPCEITSAVFMDIDGIEKSITTIMDISKGILKQKNIDIKKEKIVADNIVIAKSKQKNIDIKKEKIVADNIVIAKSKQKNIDISKQKILKEELSKENLLKEKQIEEARTEAKETERVDIGKELHDNVNQLLGASKLYLEMGKHGGNRGEFYLSRSAEYTVTAIEEIRKLTKRLTTDTIKIFGLCNAIDNITKDIMEINPVKITTVPGSFIENSVCYKFKLDVFRIVQEQLNNILKHAQAKEVTIRLTQNKRSIILSISDDGVGFDTSKKNKGIGIANIKKRAATYNGTADFVSQPGKGCILTATFSVTDALLNKN